MKPTRLRLQLDMLYSAELWQHAEKNKLSQEAALVRKILSSLGYKPKIKRLKLTHIKTKT